MDFEFKKTFQTKLQNLHRLQEGISFGDGVEYCAADYMKVASRRTKEWKAKHYPNHDLLSRHSEALENSDEATAAKKYTPENLERDYWNIVETHVPEVAVEYGNDVDTGVYGSGFPLSQRGRAINGTRNPTKMKMPEPKFGTPDYYKETWWNLNNIPCAPDSVLRHVRVGINGINVPWMYYGSLFTSFCWHNEDNYLYSINYHHKGAPKQWYGVPGNKTAADGLEKVFKSFLSMKMREVPDLLHHITTMFSPRLLQLAEVPVYKLLQYEGEFVITFPRSFHGGFSLGPNIGEAVNFATHDWIAYGADANERYRSFGRPAVFSHDRLTFTMANHLKEQKSYSTCKLLLEELERIVDEELRLRNSLKEAGVRDVSHWINLPKNVLDQLDEKSADYDDKRLCHACKHVCFFSAVACECSQSKVSCLRHSHYMCRCATSRRYFMVWSDEKELNDTLARVRAHCKALKTQEDEHAESEAAMRSEEEAPKVAPGAERDVQSRKNYEIPTDPIDADSFQRPLSRGFAETTKPQASTGVVENTFTRTSSPLVPAASLGAAMVSQVKADVSSDDDDVEVVAVVAANYTV